MAFTKFGQTQRQVARPRSSLQSDISYKTDWEGNFTSSGKPMPTHKSSVWTNACPWGEQAPTHPPFSYTDQSIVPVVVRVATNSARSDRKDGKSARLTKANRGTKKDLDIKVVKMTRADYLKYFARDANNNYVGTEPEQNWSEESLEEVFGSYQGLPPTCWSVVHSEDQDFIEEANN